MGKRAVFNNLDRGSRYVVESKMSNMGGSSFFSGISFDLTIKTDTATIGIPMGLVTWSGDDGLIIDPFIQTGTDYSGKNPRVFYKRPIPILTGTSQITYELAKRPPSDLEVTLWELI